MSRAAWNSPIRQFGQKNVQNLGIRTKVLKIVESEKNMWNQEKVLKSVESEKKHVECHGGVTGMSRRCHGSHVARHGNVTDVSRACHGGVTEGKRLVLVLFF